MTDDPKKFANGFIATYIDVIKNHYFDFKGCTDKKTFWTVLLVNYIVIGVIGFLLKIINLRLGASVSGLLSLATLLPMLGICARRLHDIGKSGWMMLVALIPCVGPFILLFWCIQPTLTVGNSFAAAAPADKQ